MAECCAEPAMAVQPAGQGHRAAGAHGAAQATAGNIYCSSMSQHQLKTTHLTSSVAPPYLAAIIGLGH